MLLKHEWRHSFGSDCTIYVMGTHSVLLPFTVVIANFMEHFLSYSFKLVAFILVKENMNLHSFVKDKTSCEDSSWVITHYETLVHA